MSKSQWEFIKSPEARDWAQRVLGSHSHSRLVLGIWIAEREEGADFGLHDVAGDLQMPIGNFYVPLQEFSEHSMLKSYNGEGENWRKVFYHKEASIYWEVFPGLKHMMAEQIEVQLLPNAMPLE